MVAKDLQPDSLFFRGAISSTVLQNLVIRGGTSLVNDALLRTEVWHNSAPSPHQLIPEVVVNFGSHGPRPTMGTVRNQSDWINSKDLLLNYKDTLSGEAIEQASKGDHGIGNFVVRFMVIPYGVASLVTFSKANQEPKLETIEKQLTAKPLYQARESSLVPLCLHPVQFMHNT